MKMIHNHRKINIPTTTIISSSSSSKSGIKTATRRIAMWAALSPPLFLTPEEAQALPHPLQHCLLLSAAAEPAAVVVAVPLLRSQLNPNILGIE
ncbi:hypothetical protein PRUPE_3G259700 [Prunus persica]|uniref:Uncharacterized protein n=1 Tax=Prunus persica TaxID=3760 RepID=A0A251Q5T8_PRUPE|nr:hypothetical protein PRUPE_3G259700 [Prunus persica]